MLLRNRIDAAQQLVPLLDRYKKENGLVLAIPRGGVPIGHYIAKHFHFPLDLLLTKKIGHPLNPELAIGAVSTEGEVIDERSGVSSAYIEKEILRLKNTLAQRYTELAGTHRAASPQNKTVIIVDDGIATGYTILAAIKMIRIKHPHKIIVAAPVAPREAAAMIRHEADDLVCLDFPVNFYGVGQFYYDFSEVSDEAVKLLMKDAEQYGRAA